MISKAFCFIAFTSTISLAYAFRPFPTRSTFGSISLNANNMDGAIIAGDLQPLWNNLLIKVKDAVGETSGGIFIPDSAKERPTEGTVTAAGPGRVHPETGFQLDNAVNVGDNVLYGKYDGIEMKYNEANHQLIKDDDVLLKYTGSVPTLDSVEPVKDQVLVELATKEETTVAGIIVSAPGIKDKRPDNGIVRKVGPGRQSGSGNRMPIRVAPGDHVRFRDYAGSEVKLDKKNYLVIRAYDILAKW
eukprot:gene14011-29834_t